MLPILLHADIELLAIFFSSVLLQPHEYINRSIKLRMVDFLSRHSYCTVFRANEQRNNTWTKKQHTIKKYIFWHEMSLYLIYRLQTRNVVFMCILNTCAVHTSRSACRVHHNCRPGHCIQNSITGRCVNLSI